MFTLRYPRSDDPHYLLTHTSEGTWRFTERDAALGAYNAGLRFVSLQHYYTYPDEYAQSAKRPPETAEVVLGEAWGEFEEACVVVRHRGGKSRRSAKTDQ